MISLRRPRHAVTDAEITSNHLHEGPPIGSAQGPTNTVEPVARPAHAGNDQESAHNHTKP